jgi:tetratricopeptide (TPR) repeat protein
VDKSREKPYLDNAWEAARKAKDDTLIVSCMMLLGSFYQRQGDSSKALDFYARASRHIDPETDPLSQAKLKLAVGTIHYQAEEYNKAMPHLLVALESSIKARDLGLQLLIINNLSTLYSVMQRFRDAEDVLLKGLETAKSNKLMMHVIRFTFNLGTLFLRQKRFEEAQGYFLECSSLATSIGFADPQFV